MVSLVNSNRPANYEVCILTLCNFVLLKSENMHMQNNNKVNNSTLQQFNIVGSHKVTLLTCLCLRKWIYLFHVPRCTVVTVVNKKI